MAVLSMDDQYLKERQEKELRDKPKHFGEGVLFGIKDFG